MTPRAFKMMPLAALANMAMLYAGKTSGVLVALVFLPLYNRLLGAEQFGMVAVILSLQALLMMLDLGMSTLVSREIAAADSSPPQLLKLIRTAEASLTGFYLGLFVGAAALKAGGGLPWASVGTVLGAVVLFWLLVLQNLYYSAMLGRRAYKLASTVQLVGVALRAVATAYVLANVSATLAAFIMTQLLIGAIHFGATRLCFSNLLHAGSLLKPAVTRPTIMDSLALIKRGSSLALFAAAGAAVLQLDKPIVLAFMTPASVAPYFLATTLCLAPISVLAGPVSQYFQPALFNAMARQDAAEACDVIKKYVLVLLLVTGLPSLFVWMLRAPIIDLWLGESSNTAAIARYVEILLPGFTLGALGFIPFSILVSAKDFRFQAGLSSAMTVITLVGATACAMFQSVEGVCYVYASYHTISTLLSWFRAIRLPATSTLARLSFALAVKSLFALSVVAVAIKYIIQIS
jgi:O-antigen/teichoic acid export membrane protein